MSAPEKHCHSYATAWLVHYMMWRGLGYNEAITILAETPYAPSRRTIQRHYQRHKYLAQLDFHEEGISKNGFDLFKASSLTAIRLEEERMLQKVKCDVETVSQEESLNELSRSFKRHSGRLWLCVAIPVVMSLKLK